MEKKKRIVNVENLVYSYDSKRNVLDGLSFSVNEGEYLAIMGHNGSGKSTLAKILLSLLPDYKGNIELFGEASNKKNRYALRHRIGIVFQNPDNQFVGSTVADDIAFGLENQMVKTEDMQGLIEFFAKETGMEDYLDHEPINLSGGQKQRVALAGVLAMKPELLVLDEATAMLDPKGKHEIANLISHMREKYPSLTIISITHDCEEALLADELMVLNEGKLLVKDKPENIFRNVDAMKIMKLDVPFVFELAYELEKQGVHVPEDIHSLSQMEEFVCQYVSPR